MAGWYTDKVVIVTGGAGGLGLAIVRAFLAQDATVVATDINNKLLEQLPTNVDEKYKAKLVPFKCDSSNNEEVDGLVSETVAKFGRLDVLVNNAGVMDNMAPTASVAREIWDRNILVNLTAPFITSQHAIRQFLKQGLVARGRGVILNVISAAGENGGRAGCAYTASKHGVVGLTKATAAFYGPKGIRCLGIMPGSMPTNMERAGHDISQFDQEGLLLARALSNTWRGDPAQGGWNFGESPLDQVAKTVMMLCSDDLNTINGALVATDMGWTTL